MTQPNPDQALLKLAAELVQRNSDPGEVHSCPVCGGDLHVFFATYKRDLRLMLGVHLQCRTCNNRVYVDYEGAPDWLTGENASTDERGAIFDQTWQKSDPGHRDDHQGCRIRNKPSRGGP